MLSADVSLHLLSAFYYFASFLSLLDDRWKSKREVRKVLFRKDEKTGDRQINKQDSKNVNYTEDLIFRRGKYRNKYSYNRKR